ncbi:hypothetical protein N7465_005012 [Penicillium sp. CMV-2018d]|nr:hypothetical protein N7465_005012 [Penicillium sp. CMV-2018d]
MKPSKHTMNLPSPTSLNWPVILGFPAVA